MAVSISDIDNVLAQVPTAMCTRSPSSGGWKVYNSVGLGFIALSGSFPTNDEAWADAWRGLVARKTIADSGSSVDVRLLGGR